MENKLIGVLKQYQVDIEKTNDSHKIKMLHMLTKLKLNTLLDEIIVEDIKNFDPKKYDPYNPGINNIIV